MTTERFVKLPPLENGDRLLAKDPSAVLATLQQGIATPKHQAFRDRLTQSSDHPPKPF